MAENKARPINTKSYDFAGSTFRRFERIFGLNIKVVGNENDALKNGEIFLFNHFARFETLIPPYIIHREEGAYCRSVADAGLFAGGGKFADLLHDVGAVPNNLPGLLPFLAAEILRGRKVVIFPEGAMIKDRRITDDAGELGIFSQKHNLFRKHHRGAAVLAFTLEMFKRRILSVFEAGNERRIKHWQTALGLPSKEALFEAASKPTLIVPGNITFYPVRIDDNILTKGVNLFAKKPSAQMIEELIIEGNLIFKETDMDIRLGEPISAKHNWKWVDGVLMRHYFKNIDSLEQFFGLKETADRLTEKLIVRRISKEANRIRDKYMEGIYKQTTVNLAHLASILLQELMGRDIRTVEMKDFHSVLYHAMKELQKQPHIALHRSLTWPDRYRGLVESDCPDLDRFIETCQKAGLLLTTGPCYKLLDKLNEKSKFHSVRLENPVLVSANEVAPLHEVRAAVANALERSLERKITPEETANNLFDDEIRTYKWNKTYYSRPRFDDLNKKETATRSGAPFMYAPADGVEPKNIGVLLVHGFLASPAELQAYGEELSRQGYHVYGVRLAGHGTSPWELHSRTWRDWLASVRRSHRILSAFVDKVVLVGFSTGGALGLLFAAENPPKLAGVASVSAPLQVQDKNMVFVPLMNQLNNLVSWLPGVEGVIPFYDNNPENKDINYRTMPVKAVNELRGVMSMLKRTLKQITLPVTIIQGDNDKVVKASSAEIIYKGLTNCPDRTLHWVKSNEHALIYKNVGDTYKHLEEFINKTSKTKLLENTPE